MNKKNRNPRREARRLSLHPLNLEEALKGAMETGSVPPIRGKVKKAAKRPKRTPKK